MALLEPPADLLQLLHEALPASLLNTSSSSTGTSSSNGNISGPTTTTDENANEEIFAYMAFLASSFVQADEWTERTWIDVLGPYLAEASTTPTSTTTNGGKTTTATDDEDGAIIKTFREAVEAAYVAPEDDAESYGDEDDDVEEVCNLRFNLAYGGKILLHNTKLRLLRGRRYALVGQNGVGKTTLMNTINTGKIDGWPHHLKTAYVDSGSNGDPDYEAQIVVPYLMKETGQPRDTVIARMRELEFTDAMMDGNIGSLSGGWQMKLRIILCVLKDPDIYLMDEPTNHLSESAVNWVTNYVNGLSHQTVIVVSHDTGFLENITTDVIHYEQREVWGPHRKLVHYKGKMSAFVEKQPQAKHYFELATTDNLKFVFPEPGRLEGVRTSTQKFLEMDGVDFRYPGCDKNQLTNVCLKMTLSSRVVVLGANGAGKTTLVKMIVGETIPSNIEASKFYIHPNLRIAYVAQHAFAHVEHFMESSPVSYIQWRFRDGYDKEKMESEAFRIPPDEQKAIDDFGIEDIWSRRMRAGKLEYEVKKRNIPEKDNKYYTRDELFALGFEHLVKQTDEKISSKEAGLDLRPVTTSEIQKHLDNFGLTQEFGTYGKIRGLSGGQKVKLVLAAAFWINPHMVVLDEPTNFLDREALGALSESLNGWGGAVLMISHNREFYSSVCKEEWSLEDGVLTVTGISAERAMKAVARKKKYKKEIEGEELLDKAGGNVNANGDKYKDATVDFWGKTVSKKDARNYEKAKKKGDVAAMRKILQIPMGKIMPGQEELGDGK